MACFCPYGFPGRSESGLYYLQSRYYDPEAGRFLNGDSLISATQGFIGNNLFNYCFNNPCRYIDPLGQAGIVGVGFQAELSTNCGTCGVEIVIYLDGNVVSNTLKDEHATFAIVMYSYSGLTLDVGALTVAPALYEMASTLDLSEMNDMTTDELLIAMIALLSDFEISGSVFVVYGYDNFTDADSYAGHFDTWSLSFPTTNPTLNAGGYISYSDTCFVIGVKASVHAPKVVTGPKFEYSHTYYSKAALLRP